MSKKGRLSYLLIGLAGIISYLIISSIFYFCMDNLNIGIAGWTEYFILGGIITIPAIIYFIVLYIKKRQ
ncbi:MAG TPA: hypothetical protein VFD03_10960 [Clostridia bacterium]|nr:hypothetical protein [Clostridia bacterium]